MAVDDDTTIATEVSAPLQSVSERLAKMIARDPSTLDKMKWLDLERVVAEIFEGLGFKSTLTPSSKDGGKDEADALTTPIAAISGMAPQNLLTSRCAAPKPRAA